MDFFSFQNVFSHASFDGTFKKKFSKLNLKVKVENTFPKNPKTIYLGFEKQLEKFVIRAVNYSVISTTIVNLISL